MTNPQQSAGQQGDLSQYNNQYNGYNPTGGGRYSSPEEAARQQLIAAGYDENSSGFWQAVTNVAAKIKGQMTADQQRSQQTRQLGQNVEYRTGLSPSGTDYMGFDHAALKDMVQTVNPSQVTGVSTAWNQLANAMATFGQQLGQAATKSGATWKGDAAESAYNFVSGLGTWSDQSGQAAQLAADQVYNQSSAAETAKNTMPDPIPFSWTDEMKSWATSNPLDIVDNVNASFQKQQQSQDAHDQAAQVMSSYDSNLYTAASKAPAFTPPPTFTGPGSSSVHEVGNSIDGTGTAGYTGPTSSNVGTTGHTGSLAGSAAGNSSHSISGDLTGLPGPTTPPRSGAKTGSVGNTSAQGYRPSSNNNYNSSSTSGLANTGLGAMGGMPMGAMGGGFGGADGDEYSSKVGRGGSGFGPGGSSSGSAASSGSAGGQSGARAGGAGAAESAAGGSGRSAGAAGRSGASGMGHGGKGKGEEDEEHQRPSWLIEPDPDDVFGTSERTAPPVIGE
ncbi:PPE domain-containing protein [Amycolatopsis sp.]|uniref:PPE domain-containing protein n=1 Tax=Amycolatopsis sp. TaxID=37632 RepID=UPI002BC8557C|nr:hypothetical protein [Amycolatopsis sp.]HVV12709.1 hypothetical protein [Amycolatopsis sp.]